MKAQTRKTTITGATRKIAKAIATELKDLDKRLPVEQMATYLGIGAKLQGVLHDEATYGARAMKDVADAVPLPGGERPTRSS